mgnify:CR=1 FL=1
MASDASFLPNSRCLTGDSVSEDGRSVTRKPIGERWPPLGAPSSELAQETSERKRSESEALKKLEEEHEQLNLSLSALTTHFAQVQFRLKQVVAAPKTDQENLLQNLEKFAFEGIPDVDGAKPVRHRKRAPVKAHEKRLQEQKQKQEKLITQLRKQLEEMEATVVKGASETTDSPQKLIEKQKLLLSQLSSQEEQAGPSHTSKDEFSDKIPKEQVIKQITKQIMDLEKFIKLLQGETGMSPKKCSKCTKCSCEHTNEGEPSTRIAEKQKKKKSNLQTALKKSPLLTSRKAQPKQRVDKEERWNDDFGVNYTVDNFGIIDDSDSGNDVACCILPKHAQMPSKPVTKEELPEAGESNQRIKEASLEIIKRALAILQIFAISQFGCTGQHLQDQLLQRAMQTPVPPYENLVRGLRTSVENVLTQQAKVLEEIGIYPHGVNSGTLSRTSRSCSISSLVSTMSSVGDGSGEFTQTEAELIRTIRREFSNCLRDLFEHGLEQNPDYSLISARSLVNCIMPTGTSRRKQNLHAWDIFMAFYNLKHGSEYNSAVPRKLSESFGIDVSGASAVTSKQTLLRTIHFVRSTHERCKRSKESMFRALVSAGLNQKKLSLWCRQIVKCGSLVDEFYQSWSCVVKTGFDDVLDILERLTPLDFCLPEDLAIRHLTRANEAFGDNY